MKGLIEQLKILPKVISGDFFGLLSRVMESTEKKRQSTEVWNEALNCRKCMDGHHKEYNKE